MNRDAIVRQILRMEDAARLLKKELNLHSKLSYSKRPSTYLVVTMPDGRVIDHKNVRNTFVEVIESLGVETVKAHTGDIVFDSEPADAFRRIGSYYVVVGGKFGSTSAKKRCLLKVSDALDVKLKIETVEAVAH